MYYIEKVDYPKGRDVTLIKKNGDLPVLRFIQFLISLMYSFSQKNKVKTVNFSFITNPSTLP